jgi:hypothetical protein
MRISLCLLLAFSLAACGSESEDPATVRIENDFDNPEFERQPPWHICKAHYRGATFENIAIGETSEPQQADPGLDHVFMVCAWEDPSCAAEHCLPIASKNEEETIAGQERTIVINVPNHQGPCPPEALGIPPIPEDLYNQILDMWPEYGFKPYDQRTENPQCQ